MINIILSFDKRLIPILVFFDCRIYRTIINNLDASSAQESTNSKKNAVKFL